MIPEGWTTRLFADVADFNAGRTPARATAEYWMGVDDGVPWVSISDMNEFGVVSHSKERITNVAFEQVFRGKVVPAGTLLMSFKLTIGRVATLGIDACHNEAIISIFPREGIDQRYLGYFLASVDYDSLQDRQIKGNTLNREKINRIQVSLPPLTEQSYIADSLDLVRRAIDLHDRLLASAHDLKRTAMRTLFTRGLRDEAQKETEIGPVPESWGVKKLEQFADVISTRMSYTELENRENSTAEAAVRVQGIKVADMNLPGNEVELKTTFLERVVDKDESEYRCAPPGTIIFPKRGAAIATNKKRLSTRWTAFDPNVIGVMSRDDIDQSLLFQWFQMFDLRTITEAGPTPQLNKKNLLPLGIPIPLTKKEQREIVSILEAIDRKIDLHRKKRAVLDELFKALLHKLMTGEVRVGELDLSALRTTVSELPPATKTTPQEKVRRN